MHNHSHSQTQENISSKFLLGIALNLVFVCVEFAYGIAEQSLSLLADAWHNLGDVAGLIISLIAIKMAEKKPTDTYTYGYSKATILASLINCVLLFFAIGSMANEAIFRFNSDHTTSGEVISWVAGIGVFINTLTALLFVRNNELNSKAAYLHMAADAAVSLGVLMGGIIIGLFHIHWVDPLLGLLICVVIFVSTWNLFKRSIRLSFDGVPDGIRLSEVSDQIKTIEGVLDVEHLHIWAISTTRNAMTANLILKKELSLSEIQTIKEEVKREVEHHNQVHHCTLETDFK